MSELNSTQTRKAREICRERDGDRCTYSGCGKTGEEYRKEKGRDLDLHHLDCNRNNNPWDGSNWSLMCHSCNCKHDPRGNRKRPYFSSYKNLKNPKGVNESERGWDGEREWRWSENRVKPAAMKKNEAAEPIYRSKVREMIALMGGIAKRKDVIDACSEAAGCAQATGSRYLDKMASFFGEFSYVGMMDNEQRTIFPIGNIASYDGEIYITLKVQPDEKEIQKQPEPKRTTEMPPISTNGNGVHH